MVSLRTVTKQDAIFCILGCVNKICLKLPLLVTQTVETSINTTCGTQATTFFLQKSNKSKQLNKAEHKTSIVLC